MRRFIHKNIAYVALIQVLVAMLGSLYASEIAHFAPCILCWYQRICLYPLVVILPVGIVLRDKKLPYYVLPLSFIGLLIGIYHNLLYYHVIPETISPCQAGVSCTTKFVEWFGVITIPFLSAMAFVVISVCMVILLIFNRKEKYS